MSGISKCFGFLNKVQLQSTQNAFALLIYWVDWSGEKQKKLGAFPSLVNGSCKLFHCVTISSDVYDVITLFTTKGKHWPFRPHSYCAISLHQKQQQQNARTRRVVFNGAIDSQWTPAPGREVMLWVSLNSHGCNIRSQQSACQDCHCVFGLL